MASPESSIRSAFVSHLLTFPGLPDVAWENTRFTPTHGAPYIRPSLLPAEPVQAEIGESGRNWHFGIFQISLFFPAGRGLSESGAMRDSLVDYFKRGTVLTYGVVDVEVTKAYGGPPLEEPNWLQLPVTIRYRVLASN